MKKKFICAVCGYIYEGDAAPEKCPICKAPASKFSELKDEGETTYATVHRIGDGKPEGVSQEMIDDLRNHSSATLSRRLIMLLVSLSCWVSAFGTRRPILRSVLLPRLALARISSVLPRTPRLLVSMLFTTLFTKWPRTRLVMALASPDC